MFTSNYISFSRIAGSVILSVLIFAKFLLIFSRDKIKYHIQKTRRHITYLRYARSSVANMVT